MVRFGDCIQDKRIRRLTSERADGFKEVYLSNVIWDTIIRFFNSHANANLMDEHIIIQVTGQSLLSRSPTPLLSPRLIHQYFSHPMTFQPEDQTMFVRQRMIRNQMVWLVFIPEWLKAEWRVAGKPLPR